MRYALATLALWFLAIAGTVLILGDTGPFTYLGPLYAVCMIGSIIVLRAAQRTAGHDIARS